METPHRGWIYIMVSLFGLGILFMIFNLTFSAYLIPSLTEGVQSDYGSGHIDNSTQDLILGKYEQIRSFFRLMPFILFVIGVIFAILLIIKRERQSELIGGGTGGGWT